MVRMATNTGKGVGVILGVCLVSGLCWADERSGLTEEKGKNGYSLGYQFGNTLKRQPVDLDIGAILMGVRDAYEGKKPEISSEEMKEILNSLKKKIWVAQQNQLKEQASKNLIQGKTFLEENGKKEGVTTLPSGLQYKVVQEGAGTSPILKDWVKIQYRGRLLDGTEFDSSYRRGKPSTLRMIGVIQGWTEALQLMKPGSRWQLFVPPDLAYGERQFGRVPPNSTLIFDMELLSVESSGPEEAEVLPTPMDSDTPPSAAEQYRPPSEK